MIRQFVIAALLVPVVGAPTPAASVDGESIVTRGTPQGATACAACHGKDGAGIAQAGYPRLAGLSAQYIVSQLDAFASQRRENAVMQPVAAALSDDQRQAVADYYAGLSLPEKPAQAEQTGDARRAVGQRLAEVGKWSEGVPACVRCHGLDGHGVDPYFPRLAGQHAAYIKAQLQAWKAGKRHNDALGLMQQVAGNLSDSDIEAVSAYFAAQAPGEQRAAGVERTRRAAAIATDSTPSASGDNNQAQDRPFTSPPESRIPDDGLGKAVLTGKRVFVATPQYAGDYVGNELSCVNCHLDRGRRDASAPMGPAFVRYPRYRAKNHQVNTIEQRIQGCFTYSENGKPPPADSDVMKGLVSYFAFLATGAPVNTDMKIAGFAGIDKAPQKPDPQRGAKVYAENCVICHGADGEGTKLGDDYQFPPLWGDASFNWGAGMHRINTAAAFIYSNMPLGREGFLSVQDAWDVAAWVDSHDRPQDPRFDGDVEATRAQFHNHNCYYGSKPPGDSASQ